MKKKKRKKGKILWKRVFLFIGSLIGGILLIALILSLCFPKTKKVQENLPENVQSMFLEPNEFSRPGKRMNQVQDIVIHYVANPGSSAEANRNYFNNLQLPDHNPGGIKASAHFVVGLNGEVIQCIPVSEIAYANAPRNEDTVSIEVCHPDETGRFSEVTYESLVEFVAQMASRFGLGSEHIIRHYDVSGKLCPKYYVEHEDEWNQFLRRVDSRIGELK